MFRNTRYANPGCRRPIEKSPLAPIEMSLSPVFESDGELAADRKDGPWTQIFPGLYSVINCHNHCSARHMHPMFHAHIERLAAHGPMHWPLRPGVSPQRMRWN